MMAPIYHEMAEVLGLPDSHEDAENFRLSIPTGRPFRTRSRR